ncbi:MAG: SGNH/GDSL hydrolase family protein [Bacteroidetes bacterium]|nr:SGNH/GDSL hydrolase family protein [Bacteroidota bacterium]
MKYIFDKFILSVLFVSVTTLQSHEKNKPVKAFPVNATEKTYLALGDSYTIGESVPETYRYPVQTTALLNKAGLHFRSPEIIATTGWTTADLQHAIDKYHFTKTKYDIVTLLIGVNNQYQGKSQAEYEEQFTWLLQKAIQLAGNDTSHVIVLSIPDYSVTPFANGSNVSTIATQIDAFNASNKMISENYHVHYLNVTTESRKASADPSLIASDGLHFSGKEYAIWSLMLADTIKEILK